MDVDKVEAKIDELVSELGVISKHLSNPNIDLHNVRRGLDRLEAIRSFAFSLKVQLSRTYHDAKWEFEDGFREMASRGGRNQRENTAYEERKATYETRNLALIQELRKWGRVHTEVTDFLKHVEAKIRWADSKRFILHDEEKREHYTSNKEYVSRD